MLILGRFLIDLRDQYMRFFFLRVNYGHIFMPTDVCIVMISGRTPGRVLAALSTRLI